MDCVERVCMVKMYRDNMRYEVIYSCMWMQTDYGVECG